MYSSVGKEWWWESVAFTICNFFNAKGSLKEQCHKICGFHHVQFCMCKRKFKRTVPWDFRLQVFSWISIPLGSFQFFFIHGNIHSSGCTTCVADTGGKFTTSVIDTSGKLPLVSLTPAANWHRRQIWHRWQIWQWRQICRRYHYHWWQIYKVGCKCFFLIHKPQIRKLSGSICNRKSANFYLFWLICKFAVLSFKF